MQAGQKRGQHSILQKKCGVNNYEKQILAFSYVTLNGLLLQENAV